uniref:Uncharacterized protein n=1 Tax=Glossina austeni TaxID=7395 RepID=A0A1A9VF81_GLOAU
MNRFLSWLPPPPPPPPPHPYLNIHRELRHRELRHRELRHRELRHRELRHRELRHRECSHREPSRSLAKFPLFLYWTKCFRFLDLIVPSSEKGKKLGVSMLDACNASSIMLVEILDKYTNAVTFSFDLVVVRQLIGLSTCSADYFFPCSSCPSSPYPVDVSQSHPSERHSRWVLMSKACDDDVVGSK